VVGKAAENRAQPDIRIVLNRYSTTTLIVLLMMLASACSTGGQASMLTPTPTERADVQAVDIHPTLSPGVTDFRLPDAISGDKVSLSETLETKHVVLVFYRAFW
jgi:hypothetical protein